MSKKKFTIFGNCQSAPIALLLLNSPSFARKYEYTPTQHVQEIGVKDLENWKKTITECDLIIYQKISDTYRIPDLSSSNMLRLAKPDAVKLSFPSLYFNAYFPFLGRKISPSDSSPLNLIEDYFWLGLYASGLSHEQAREIILDEDLFSSEEAESFYIQSIEELVKREQNIDITASDVYAKTYQKLRVGYLFNHPTTQFFTEIANKILEVLNEDSLTPNQARKVKQLDHLSVGIYPSLYKRLGLEFAEDSELYMTMSGPHSLSFLLAERWNYYKENYTQKTLLKTIQTRKPWVVSKLSKMAILKPEAIG